MALPPFLLLYAGRALLLPAPASLPLLSTIAVKLPAVNLLLSAAFLLLPAANLLLPAALVLLLSVFALRPPARSGRSPACPAFLQPLCV
eukprot:scaffold209149_cov17-Tisochrysis_lutea.AAC.1